MKKVIEIKEIESLQIAAKFLVDLSKEFSHFCFEAPMGAGKTTLINEVCKQLGVTEHTSSPTYSIVNEYEGKNNAKIYHFDLYRIKDEIELLDIGIVEILDSNSICFIEWPEKILPYLSEKFVNLSIEVIGASRIITITY